NGARHRNENTKNMRRARVRSKQRGFPSLPSIASHPTESSHRNFSVVIFSLDPGTSLIPASRPVNPSGAGPHIKGRFRVREGQSPTTSLIHNEIVSAFGANVHRDSLMN